MGGSVGLFSEGGCERVECGLLPDHPACPAPAGGVKGVGHQVQAFQRGLLVGEVPAGLHGPVVPRVDGLGGVGCADHLPDLQVVGQERYDTAPTCCVTAARSPDTGPPTRWRTRHTGPWPLARTGPCTPV